MESFGTIVPENNSIFSERLEHMTPVTSGCQKNGIWTCGSQHSKTINRVFLILNTVDVHTINGELAFFSTGLCCAGIDGGRHEDVWSVGVFILLCYFCQSQVLNAMHTFNPISSQGHPSDSKQLTWDAFCLLPFTDNLTC